MPQVVLALLAALAAAPAARSEPGPAKPPHDTVLEELVDGARIVTIGTTQVRDPAIDARTVEALRTLVEHHGVRLVALECAGGAGESLESWLAGETDRLAPETLHLLRPFGTPPFVDFLEWVRERNRTPGLESVRIIGLHPESPVHDLRTIRDIGDSLAGTRRRLVDAVIERVEPVLEDAPSDLALAVRLETRRRRGHPGIQRITRQRAIEAVEALEVSLEVDRSAFIRLIGTDGWARLSVAATSLRTWLETDALHQQLRLANRLAPAEVDRLRSEAHELIEHGRMHAIDLLWKHVHGAPRTVVWTKAWNAARDSETLWIDAAFGQPRGVRSLGARLEDELDERHVQLLVARPTPIDEPGDLGARLDGAPRTVDLARDPGTLPVDRPLDVVLEPATGVRLHAVVLGANYDGLLVADPPAQNENEPATGAGSQEQGEGIEEGGR